MVGKVQRCTLNIFVFIGTDKVPVHIGNLGDGADDLELKGLVGDLLIIFRDAEIAEVGPETEAGEKLLLKEDAVVGIELGSEEGVETVVGDAVVIQRDR